MMACAAGAPGISEQPGNGAPPFLTMMDAGTTPAAPDASSRTDTSQQPPSSQPAAGSTGGGGSAGGGSNTTADASTASGSGDCTNGNKDGFETDTDCGGPGCDPCPYGDTCLVDTDCVTDGVCMLGLCTCTKDSDGDGVSDCDDECPEDPARTTLGTCGCVGEPDPAPATTDCDYGICPGATKCDGLGSCGALNDCIPPSTGGCGEGVLAAGTVFFVCSDIRSWNEARTICTDAGYDLISIDSAALNDAVQAAIGANSWIGASDSASENRWVWPDGTQFSNDSTPLAGFYANWASGEPNNDGGLLRDQNCGSIYLADGTWDDLDCGDDLPFVCGGP